LSNAGVYTHLVTDHQHYWEDGGATYHTRYDTHEFFRGQEGDSWKGHVETEFDVEVLNNRLGPASFAADMVAKMRRQDQINRMYQPTIETHSQTLTFDAGLHFVETNKDADSWFLQIECFDPHEPFFSYGEHREHYAHQYDGPQFDWPDYAKVFESEAEADHLRAEYKALLTFCDQSLGRVLDAMDKNNMWDDTLLIVCTDHGLLLGERGWWGKSVQPWFDENIHTPLFIWDPRYRVAGQRSDALVQTVDFGPTLLDFFGVPIPELMQGQPIGPVIAEGREIRDAGLFGNFGAHVSVTDGRYVYMRACATPENRPLFEYTLMPTHMRSMFSPAELAEAELVPPLSFTKGAPVLKIPGRVWGSPWQFGTLLFDMENDPNQQHPLTDPDLELRMANLLVAQMRQSDAPVEQFERLGLPATGPVGPEHLLAKVQHEQVINSMRHIPRLDEVEQQFPIMLRPLKELADDPQVWEAVIAHLPMLANESFARSVDHVSIYRLAVESPAVTAGLIEALGAALAAFGTELG